MLPPSQQAAEPGGYQLLVERSGGALVAPIPAGSHPAQAQMALATYLVEREAAGFQVLRSPHFTELYECWRSEGQVHLYVWVGEDARLRDARLN